AEPLERDGAARLDRPARPERAAGRLGDVDASGFAGGFQPRRGVDGIAPYVVAELVLADDAGDEPAGVDADAQADPARGDESEHLESELGDRLGMVRPRLRQPAG